MDSIKVSEHFLSIQGEGRSTGRQCIFWRLTGCVLNCVWCDTTEVWKKGTTFSFREWSELAYEQGYFHRLENKISNLVLTGGDPMIQQRSLVGLFQFMRKEFSLEPLQWNIEVETQGTVPLVPEFGAYVTQWNLSPKLANSGEPLRKRYRPDVVREYVQRCENYQLKFVIGSKEDADEAMEWFQHFKQSKDNANRVWFMPQADTREKFIEIAPMVAQLALECGVNFSPRLHLVLWDRKTGV